MTSPRPARPRPQTPGEKARTAAEEARTDAGVALARFDATTRAREGHRRRIGLLPLGADPASAAPAGWAEDTATDLVASAGRSQRITPEQAEEERRQLLWFAVLKILGAVLAACAGIGIAAAIFSGMWG